MTEAIRSVALVGQQGAGKTTLLRALAAGGGVTGGDADEHTLAPSVTVIEHDGRRIHVVDTPGYPDFLGTTLYVLDAVDLVAVVINAQAGIEPMTRDMVQRARSLGLPCMLVINRIDAAPDALEGLVQQITDTFGRDCLPLELPADHARKVVEVLAANGGDADFDSVAHAHEAIVDQIVELDEQLMERYLEEGDVDAGALHDPFERALREGHLVPVTFVSARSGAGVAELLHVLADLAPSPAEAGGHPFVDASGAEVRLEPDPDAALVAHVFRVEFDPFVGRVGLVRVHRGRLRKGAQVLVDGEATLRVGHLFSVNGGEHADLDEAGPGEICGIAKIDELRPGTVLQDARAKDPLRLRPLTLPEPLVGVALVPHSRADEQKVSDVLAKLVAEDPCLRVEHDRTSNEQVLRGLGELHLKVTLARMAERFRVQVDTHPPSVPYRETVTRRAQGHCRHKKQTGGAGQFGEVFLTVEPLPRGAGFEFVDQVKGGVIPGTLIPAVEKGVRQAMEHGVVAGFPMQDVRVTVTDGKHHPVDSKEIAFVTAGRKAFQAAAREAGPIVLEPVAVLQVTAPPDAVGGITADLSSRRGRILGSDMAGGGAMRVDAEVPFAEIDGYSSRLNTLTGGAGSWTMAFGRYDPAPAPVQKDLATARAPGAHDD